MFLVFGVGVLHGFNVVLISFFEGLTALSLGCTKDSRFEGCRLSKGLEFKKLSREFGASLTSHVQGFYGIRVWM